MENVDRWLKSLRLHKYTHLFRSLTYEEMLNIHEKFLIDLDITKGARNKILVSVKKLNLRHDRLANMEDDLNQDNISLKEALNVMKDMLITPIPKPLDEGAPSPTISLPESTASSASSSSSSPSSTTSGSTSGYDNTDSFSITSTGSTPISTPTSPVESPYGSLSSMLSKGSGGNYYTNPYELTHLFVETLDKLAQRLIDSSGFEDNACHGIMAAIVDECLKHNSFTKEQKSRVARFRQPIMRDHMARVTRYAHQPIIREQKVRMVGSRQQLHYNSHLHYQQQQHKQHQDYPFMRQSYQQQQQQHKRQQHFSIQPPYHPQPQYHFQQSHNQQQQQQHTHHTEQRKNVNIYSHHSAPYKEYSLLGPGLTFELPCLRAKAEAEKHNRSQSGFFTSISGGVSSSG